MHFKAINNYGEMGLILDFGSFSSESISQEVHFVYSKLLCLELKSTNIVPSFNKIVISFTSTKERERGLNEIKKNLKNFEIKPFIKERRHWQIPTCYADDYALDLKKIQKKNQLSKEEVIAKHSQKTYYTYFIGFMPGFPYLGDIDKSIVTPRHANPRIQIPARSVGIAKEYTCIYPKMSPGGWNIIAQIPFDIFSLSHSRSSLFLPGDEVKFISVSQSEFIKIQNKKFKFEELLKEFSK